MGNREILDEEVTGILWKKLKNMLKKLRMTN